MAGSFVATILVALLSAAPIVAASPAPSPSAASDAPIVTVSPVPLPSAASDAPETPLREIGRVHAVTLFCKTALEQASTGVAIALDNDQRITDTEQILRVEKPDDSELGKQKMVADLGRQFVALKAAATAGNRLMAQLKAMVKDAPTPEQAQALLSFQQALDGVLMRQKRLGDVIARMTVILDNHPRIDVFQENANQMAALESQNNRYAYKDPQGPFANLPYTLKEIAQQDADDLEYRATPVQRDEDTAADRIDAAFNGC